MTARELQDHLDRVLPPELRPAYWPTNCCRIACDSLTQDKHFRAAAPEAKMMWGTAAGHYWLQQPDGTILDPTASQFHHGKDCQVFPAGTPLYSAASLIVEEHLAPTVVCQIREMCGPLTEPDRAARVFQIRAAIAAARAAL